MSLRSETRMDKSVFSSALLADPADEPAYWRTQSPEARLVALELMRQIMYGPVYNPAADRLPRVLEVIEHAKR